MQHSPRREPSINTDARWTGLSTTPLPIIAVRTGVVVGFSPRGTEEIPRGLKPGFRPRLRWEVLLDDLEAHQVSQAFDASDVVAVIN